MGGQRRAERLLGQGRERLQHARQGWVRYFWLPVVVWVVVVGISAAAILYVIVASRAEERDRFVDGTGVAAAFVDGTWRRSRRMVRPGHRICWLART